MAAYHKVEVSLNTNAVEVGIPSPQSVTVTVPTVGPVGPQGPAGPKGDPGDVSGSIAWDNVTDKPSTFTPSSHTHVAADITDFTSAVEAVSPPADWDTLANKPASFTPTSHASSHATGGSDPLAPSDIGAMYALEIRSNQTITADTTLTSGRNIQQQIDSYATGNLNLTLPISGVQSGDSFKVIGRAISTGDIVIRKQNHDGSGFGPQFSTLATVTENPQVYTFRAAAAAGAGWLLIPVDSHTQPASTITGLGTAATQDSTDFAAASHSHSDATASVAGFLSAADKTKLDGIAAGAEVNVNADWNASSGDAQILNKPTLGTAAAQDSTAFAAASHTHAASAITSGTLAHERGGLEADVSAYNGLVKISGGSTSAVTVTSAGEALLDDADAAAQRTTLGLGTAATSASTDFSAASHTHGNITNAGLVGTTANLPLKTGTGGIVEAGAFGTGAGEFAEGNHTHTQLHDKSHTMTDVTSHTAGNHKVFYSDGSGQIQELALGNSGEVLTSNGATSAPSFAAASGGVSAVNSTLADILSVSGSDLVADDLGADKLYGWDDSESKAIGFTIGSGLETDTTTLKAKITSDPTGVTGADAITNIMSLTQAEYNAIGSPNASTLYIITDP